MGRYFWVGRLGVWGAVLLSAFNRKVQINVTFREPLLGGGGGGWGRNCTVCGSPHNANQPTMATLVTVSLLSKQELPPLLLHG